MRFLVAAGAILLANLCSVAAHTAEAQGLPKYLKSCKKEKTGITVEDTLVVPSADGPPGIVKIVRQTYDCRNPETRNNQWIALYGMTDAKGKVLVPLEYASVLPFSTKGAVVIDHGDDAYPGGPEVPDLHGRKRGGERQVRLQMGLGDVRRRPVRQAARERG